MRLFYLRFSSAPQALCLSVFPLLYPGGMFGATAVRQKRERERREKLARLVEQQVFPYIKPYGTSFDRRELPYFKHRETLCLLHEGAEEGEDDEKYSEVGIRQNFC